jgi:hypothetical protein
MHLARQLLFLTRPIQRLLHLADRSIVRSTSTSTSNVSRKAEHCSTIGKLSSTMLEDGYSNIWSNASLAGLGLVVIGTLPYHFLRGPQGFIAPLGLLFVFACAKFWQSQVTKFVSEPYLVSTLLDEKDSNTNSVSRTKYFTFHKHKPIVMLNIRHGIQNSQLRLGCTPSQS